MTPPPPPVEEEGDFTLGGGTGSRVLPAAAPCKVRASATTFPPTIDSRWPIEVFFDGKITY
jgi:hypothetical protein